MKKIIFTILFLSSVSLFAQDSHLLIDSFYNNKESLLIISNISQFDSVSRATLIGRVKNWASTKFVSLKDVLVSETDDQIVFSYIDNSYYVKSGKTKLNVPWYIRLVVQAKDGKIKCSYYDDGNTFMQGSEYVPDKQARTSHFNEYFKDDNGSSVAVKVVVDGLIAIHGSLTNNFESLKKSIENAGNANW